MLRWLQPKLPDKYLLLIKLFTFSSVLHTVVCCMLFFLYNNVGTSTLVEVHASSSQAVVRMISFNKPKQSGKSGLAIKKGASGQSSKKNTLQGTQQRPKTALGKSAAHKKTKKNTPKKIEKKVTKPILQPPAQTKQEPKVIEKKVMVPEKVIEQEVVVPQTVTPATQEDTTIDEQLIEYLTPKEYEQALIQDALKEAIVSVWAPPAGMSDTLVCEVLLAVGFDGSMLEAKIEKKSGVLIYDIAVEQALTQVVMPRQLWGKKVKIAFKP